MAHNNDVTIDAMPREHKAAFLKAPAKIELPQGTRVFRLAAGPLPPGVAVSPWWSLVESMDLPNGEVFDGFWVSARRAHRIHKPIRDYLRARTAISDRFNNPMTHLIVAALKQPTWCFAGKAAGQPEFRDEDDVILIGGAHQLWIPKLMFPEHIQPSSLWPRPPGAPKR